MGKSQRAACWRSLIGANLTWLKSRIEKFWMELIPASTDITYFANARTGLKYSLLNRGMSAGDKILVPDFICDSIIHPLLQLKITPIFYPTLESLSPDWDALNSLVNQSSCRAIFMVHYFGQPQDIERFASFCSRHNLLLIEDNSHGYGGGYEGRPLGSFGDIGFSSPRKFLGIPSGGVLQEAGTLPDETLRKLKPFPVFWPKPIVKTILSLCHPALRFIRAWADRNKDWGDPFLYQESLQPDYAIDSFSRWRIQTADWHGIATRRRKNWAAWDAYARCKGLQPVFSKVYPESCPWALPVYTRDISERNFWLVWGAKNKVSLFPWPALSKEIVLQDGDALARWKVFLCFPLDLSPEALGL